MEEKEIFQKIKERYPDLKLPDYSTFRKLFPQHSKFVEESFLVDFLLTISQELKEKFEFLFNRLFPGEDPLFLQEFNFIKEKRKENLRFLSRLRKNLLIAYQALEKFRIQKDENTLIQTLNSLLEFFEKEVCPFFEKFNEELIKGWEKKEEVEEEKNIYYLS
jgi:hypothetical protein